MARSLRDRTAQAWQQRLMRFEKSRRTVGEFCRQEGVSAPSFYLWRKRLAQVRRSKRSADKPAGGFRPVRLRPAAELRVQLPGGTQLVVPMSDLEGLRSVIDVLTRADAQRSEVRPC